MMQANFRYVLYQRDIEFIQINIHIEFLIRLRPAGLFQAGNVEVKHMGTLFVAEIFILTPL
jgi:hypothetical protein